MFQLIGSLLAFALATFLWVMIANPNRRTNLADDGAPWGATYERSNR